MSVPRFEVGAVVLGYVGIVATWRRASLAQTPYQPYVPMLTIQQCSSSDDGFYVPPECITLTGRDGLLALRAAIDEALKVGEVQP